MEPLTIMESYADTNDDVKKNFIGSIESKLNVKTNYERKEVDLAWVSIFEETLPYIDNILRNPKKFIINEEEIVKVEQSRKVTVESIIHLTQHTNLIQDYNPETEDVRPAKILNINKEESLDMYENRFVYTLLKQMLMFLEQHYQDGDEDSYKIDEKKLTYDAKAELNNEKVKIQLTLNANDNVVMKEPEVNGLSVSDRLKKIKVQMDGFTNSDLYKTLAKLHVALVRPPIRKTNVILKNPNFQKAVILYDYLLSYNKNSYNYKKDNQDYMEVGFLKDQFDEAFLINYLALNSLSDNPTKKTEEKFVSYTVNKIIECILDSDEEIERDDFFKIINREFTSAKEKIQNRDQTITKIFNEQFEKVRNDVGNLYAILD